MAEGKELAIAGKGISPREPDWALSVQSLIDQIQDEDSARETIDNIRVLEHRLVEQKALKHFACEFCRLEAEMWVHIAVSGIDVEGSELFTRREKNLVAWLRTKNQQQLTKILAKCSRGTRLSNVKDNESSKRNHDETVEELERISDLIVSAGEQTGETKLTSQVFYDSWTGPGIPSRTAVHAYRERTKVRLQSCGMHSTGDGTGSYYNPKVTTHEQNLGIIANLSDRIVASISNLAAFCEKTGEHMPADTVAYMLEEIGKLASVNK